VSSAQLLQQDVCPYFLLRFLVTYRVTPHFFPFPLFLLVVLNFFYVLIDDFNSGRSTAGFGDIPFKQPPAFTRRILYNLFPGFHNTSPWEEFLVRNQTPPYITAEPQIIHRRLDGDDNSNPSAALGLKRTKTKFSLHSDPPPPTQPAAPAPLPRFLILASDGFSALCDGERQVRVIESWARSMVARDPPASVTDAQPGSRTDNMALRLLRLALGGDDRFGVSRMLTLDVPDDSWMDDTSIVIRTI
jgi:pyruvate dehydrogenase phosphatase